MRRAVVDLLIQFFYFLWGIFHLTYGPIPQIGHYPSNFSVVADIDMVVILHFLSIEDFYIFQSQILELFHQLHMLPRGQWFLSYCDFYMNTCRTLCKMFCSVDIDKRGQIRQRCTCPLVCSRKGEMSHVKGYHVYKTLWIPVIGECLLEWKRTRQSEE